MFTAPGPLPVARAALSEGVTLHADAEVERQRRLEMLKTDLVRQMSAGQGVAALDRLLTMMAELERENERLAWQVLRANRFRFGRSTEKLSKDDLAQLYRALGGEENGEATPAGPLVPAPEPPEQVEGDAVPDDAASPKDATAPPAKKKRKRVNTMRLGPQVERIVTPVPIAPEECTCALCGRRKTIFDFVEHEQISYVPAKIVVHIERREKALCEHCHKDLSVAPRQHTPAVARKVDASLLAKLIADKTTMALPVDRQRRELARMGLDIPDKTLDSYWAYTTELLEPVAVVTQADVFASPLVGADDAHLKHAREGVEAGRLPRSSVVLRWHRRHAERPGRR